jgi:hypothetical protein
LTEQASRRSIAAIRDPQNGVARYRSSRHRMSASSSAFGVAGLRQTPQRTNPSSTSPPHQQIGKTASDHRVALGPIHRPHLREKILLLV